MKHLTIFVILCTLLMVSSSSRSNSNVIEQQLNGSLKLIASPKGNVNPSAPFDYLNLQNITIPFNIAPLAGRNQLRSTFQWAGKTHLGFAVDWQLAGPGEAIADWNANPPVFTFDLPFIFNCTGKRLPVRLKFTAGSQSDVFGSTQGYARKISDTSADLLLNAPASFFFNWKDLSPNGENRQEEFVGRATFTGKINAVNGSKLF